ncbi:AcrR family transcriptional regulator [Bacillus sp. SORGH_AS 510]|uniref:TetR/AcrR family transcriptional regulator n=1 Tax=Bacillus sp. SORGH_AS_0510 TaxID=3041771 RepID=UPI0027839CFB|nr:TetR family transcriptional regulator [Bacillus sp. SORGH_AS_0510]MDQ1147643.1 AcrR family transcriptional regulator [Bacillus sp. SORGH_AS_0510]
MTPKISDSEKEKRKKHIIDSAVVVFTRKGYVNSTMQDIVDETGMSRGWVYLYFSNKEDIMLAILAENDKETEAQINNLLTSGLSVWQGLSGLIDMMDQQFNHASDDLPIVIYEYFISGWKQPERREYLEVHYKKQHEYLSLYLQQGVANGEFRPSVDLDVIIKMITSYFEGLLLHSKAAGSNNVRVSEQLKLFKAMLMSVLQVDETEGGL